MQNTQKLRRILFVRYAHYNGTSQTAMVSAIGREQLIRLTETLTKHGLDFRHSAFFSAPVMYASQSALVLRKLLTGHDDVVEQLPFLREDHVSDQSKADFLSLLTRSKDAVKSIVIVCGGIQIRELIDVVVENILRIPSSASDELIKGGFVGRVSLQEGCAASIDLHESKMVRYTPYDSH